MNTRSHEYHPATWSALTVAFATVFVSRVAAAQTPAPNPTIAAGEDGDEVSFPVIPMVLGVVCFVIAVVLIRVLCKMRIEKQDLDKAAAAKAEAANEEMLLSTPDGFHSDRASHHSHCSVASDDVPDIDAPERSDYLISVL